MGVFGICVTFIMVWWLTFILALPFGNHGARELGHEVEHGTDPGAPVRPRLKLKAMIASGIALPVVIVIWAVVQFHLLTLV